MGLSGPEVRSACSSRHVDRSLASWQLAPRLSCCCGVEPYGYMKHSTECMGIGPHATSLLTYYAVLALLLLMCCWCAHRTAN